MASAVTSSRVPALPAERFFQGSLLLFIFSAVATLIATGKLDIVSSVLATLAIVYKGWHWWQGKPRELSHRTATILVVSYLGVFPLDMFLFSRAFVASSTNPSLYAALLAAVHFLLFVTFVRLYSAATDRDAFFLAILAFAAVLAAAILTIDTSFLIFFFVFLLFGVATFVGMEMRRGGKGALASPAVQPAQEKKMARALSLAAFSAALGAMVMGGTLFFFFPRFTAGYLGRTGMQPSLMTGFTDDIELGQIGEIKKSPEVVMRVKTGKLVNYPQLRWRGIALSTFDGKRWSIPNHRPMALAPNSSGWIYVADPEQDIKGPGVALQYEVLVQPMATDAVFVPSNALSMLGGFSGENPQPGITSRRNYLFRDFTGSLFNPFRTYTPVRYFGNSRLPLWDPAKLRAASTEYPEAIRDTYLQLPVLDPRIPRLSKGIVARVKTPYDQARSIESYLRSQYKYTLELTGKPGDDPLAHFLFETRAGHCEYFASAMTIMLRTLGIPSREVNGFLPGEFNDLAGDYIVRASDAHSWVEAYFPGSGWVTFDPTPAAIENFGLLSRVGQYLDWMELSWNEWVINYDFAHQVQMAQLMQRSTRNWKEAAGNWFAKKQAAGKEWLLEWMERRGRITFALPMVLILLLALLRYDGLEAAARRLRLYLQLRAPEGKRANPQLASRLYGELLRVLERKGFARRESQTPLEFAGAVGEPAVAPAVLEFTQIYARARFGGTPCDTTRLRQLLDQIREEFHAGLRRAKT
jgi:protein-glutamine gamma-glutamyltransferase